MTEYEEFLRAKSQMDTGSGFAPKYLPGFLFDFQSALVDWAVRVGRASIFADCGMGKTPMSLVWSQNIVQETNKPVLIMAPLSVSSQTVEEAEKFGVEAKRSLDGKFGASKIVVTNYERLHYFNPNDFAGVVCDESSCIKNFDGSRKGEITEFMKKVKYRLLCTATAAPNDYIELGTSSEALGYLGYMDMLSQFFKNDEDNLHPAFIGTKFRFKRHAEGHFWRWMASWARACRKPSDLGFEDRHFVLPELKTTEHTVGTWEDEIFGITIPQAKSLEAQRKDTKVTLVQRCEKAASLLEKSPNGIAWCHLNQESELLNKLIPGSVQVSGSDSDERKEEVFRAFRMGEVRVLVTKPKIAAFGMNWQHCNHMTYFPTHSFEQYYQAVRRCWRFGQKNPVSVDVVVSEAQSGVLGNLNRKSEACETMFEQLIGHMNNAIHLDRMTKFSKKEEVPSWL